MFGILGQQCKNIKGRMMEAIENLVVIYFMYCNPLWTRKQLHWDRA